MPSTIKDIADKAGVSTATVSRYINKSGFVKDETSKRLAEVIQELSYVPRDAAKRTGPKLTTSTLLKYHNFTIVWSGGSNAMMGPTAQSMLVGITEEASKVDATVNMVSASQQELPENLLNGRTDGLILQGGGFSPDFLERAQRFPCIWLLQSGLHQFGDRVQPDHAQVGSLAMQYLQGKGCRSLVCITNHTASFHNDYPLYWQTRQASFQTIAEMQGIPCVTIESDFNDNQFDVKANPIDAAQYAVRQLLKCSPKVDGIFVANSLGAPVYAELCRNGLTPGKNLWMVAGDKEVCSGYFNPVPALIDIQACKIGELAVTAMLNRIHYPAMPYITYLVTPLLEEV